MNLKPISCLLIGFALTACGSPNVAKLGAKLGASVVGVKGAAAPVLVAPKDAPQIWMSLLNRGIKFPLGLAQSSKGVEIWVGQDGTQVFLRDGMIIGTRGFGQDLMSAAAPTQAVIRSRGGHKRQVFAMDGTDTMQNETFDCQVTQAKVDPAYPKSMTLEEYCAHPDRAIRNIFTYDKAGKLLKSRQWVTKSVGIAIIEAKNGS